MQSVLAVLWLAGACASTVLILCGLWLVLDFHFRASEAIERVVAQLSLYESLSNGAIGAAKEEILRILSGRVRAQPVPLKVRS